MGKTMADWLRFSVCFWHSFRGTGMQVIPFHCSYNYQGLTPLVSPPLRGPGTMGPTQLRTPSEDWEQALNSSQKWASNTGPSTTGKPHLPSQHPSNTPTRDISPMGETLDETNKNLDEMTDLAQELQKQTGVKLLWATCNLFAHPMYSNGASTSPDAHVFSMAAAQVKKGLEIAKKLGAAGFGEEGKDRGVRMLSL